MNSTNIYFRLSFIVILGTLISACGKLTEEVDNSFVIGGKAFGLINSVVLRNDSTNEEITVSGGNKPDTVPSDETSFNFNRQSSFASNYKVSVKTQPSNPIQSCVVRNGEGKVANTDITNIAIVCTTTQFNIGGTISGLPTPLGQGVTIRANDKDLLEVSTNVAFTFTRSGGAPVGYDDHSEYTVKIVSQPKDPTLHCVMSNGSDTITDKVNGDHVTNIDITCEDITAPTIIKTSPNDNSIGISRSTSAEIFFSEIMDSEAMIEAGINDSLILNDGSTNVSATVNYIAENRSLLIEPDTTLSAKTTHTVTIGSNVTDRGTPGVPGSGNPPADFTLTFTTADGLWNQPELVEQLTNTASEPQIAIDSSGNMIAVWQQRNGSHHDIYANYYTVGGGWGTEELIEHLDQAANYPQVIFDGDGNATAVWQQIADGETNTSIWANRYTAGGGWGATPLLVETEKLGDAHNPQLSVTKTKDVIVVWSQNNGIAYQIYSNRYTGGNWQTPAPITNNTAGQNARKPKLAIDKKIGSNDDIYVTWQQESSLYSNIYAARYTTSWQPIQLIDNNTGNAYAPEISIDSANNVYVTWRQQSDGERSNIWINRLLSGATNWGNSALIESQNEGDALNPKIASDTVGNTFVIWQQHDGSNHSIWNNRLTATTIGTEENISKVSNLDAKNPQTIFDSNNNAIATWSQDNGQIDQLMASRYDNSPSLGWGAPELISQSNKGAATAASLHAGPTTSTSLVWSESDGTDFNIYFNQYTLP